VFALVAAAMVDVATIALDWVDAGLMSQLLRGDAVTQAELDASHDRQTVVGIAYLVMLVVGAFFFIRWFHPAYANLRKLGQPTLRHGDGWAIGSWFIPVAGLWLPKKLANDVWRATDPSAPPAMGGEGWLRIAPPPLLQWWWGAWIVSNILAQTVGRLALSGDGTSDIRTSDRWDILASGVDIVAALLAIAVVYTLTRREADLVDRHARAEAVETTTVVST
jgi:hypothetical protein